MDYECLLSNWNGDKSNAEIKFEQLKTSFEFKSEQMRKIKFENEKLMEELIKIKRTSFRSKRSDEEEIFTDDEESMEFEFVKFTNDR